MTTVPATVDSPAVRWPQRAAGLVRDVVVLTRRNLIHIAREPMQLSDVTFQPVLFTLLFIWVLGSGVPVAGGYKEFAIAGLLALNLVTSSMGSAVGLATDMSTGVIDRFRALPMWRAAVLVGRSIADLITSVIAVAFVLGTGLLIGWRPHASVASVVGALAVTLLFTYGLSWACACLGIVAKGPESGASVGLLLLFPLAIVSNAMVPTQGMPAWIRQVANWNPVSAVTATDRHLFGNPNPSAAIHAWPMQHPLEAALLWSVAILAAFAPLAAFLYRRRTTG